MIGAVTLAAADIKDRVRRRDREQLVERELEACHQAPHDGVAEPYLSNVLPVGTPVWSVALTAPSLPVLGFDGCPCS